MTTKVTVAANHGWPVMVTMVDKDQDGAVSRDRRTRVPAGASMDFYVHSHRDIEVHEIQPGEPEFGEPEAD